MCFGSATGSSVAPDTCAILVTLDSKEYGGDATIILGKDTVL